jgi:hypothetical protein
VYVNLAKGTNATAYNIAVADWFGEPQILDLDITGWTGGIGQEIRVKAQDNVKVTRFMNEDSATLSACIDGSFPVCLSHGH